MNKKILKGVGVLALAGIFAFPTMNVKADDVCSGKTVYTNYYMFLDVNDTDFPKGLTTTDKSYYTAAYKNNNIPKGAIINGSGQVNVDETGSNGGWTLDKYWTYAKYQYKADTNTMVYNDGNTNYFFHKAWYAYTNADQLNNNESGVNHPSSQYDFSGISNDKLIAATVLPSKTKVTAPAIYTSPMIGTDTEYRWTTMRNMNSNNFTGKTAVAVPTTTGSSTTIDVYYAPAAYYITWCSDTASTPATNKWTLSYDANGSGASVPASSSATCGTDLTVSDIESKVDGKTFAGWALKSDATKADYKVGDKVTSSATSCGDVKLYAIFTNNATSNAKTGKFLNILGFSSVGIAAAVGYLYTKRKSIFKKIK